MRGIQDARDDPEAATDIVMQFAPNEDRAHQLSMLKVELDMADGPVARQCGLGWTTTEQWQAFHDSLLQYGGITPDRSTSARCSANKILDRSTRTGNSSGHDRLMLPTPRRPGGWR